MRIEDLILIDEMKSKYLHIVEVKKKKKVKKSSFYKTDVGKLSE